jgi:cell division protein FtsI/penicillin-binding protein 2
VNFFAELFADLSTVVFDRGDTVEGDLILSIEPTVQASLERELASVMEEHRSALSGGIVMDPRTGAIIAMAGTPGFDLNAYGSVDDLTRFKNPNVENLYEMGSTVKPLTMAAGLDAGVITPKSTYDDPGVMTLDRRTFGNFDGRARGPGTTMQQILSESLNTGVAHIVGRLGNEQFAEYFLDRFRIGEETGIDLPGEAQGLVTNLSSTRDIEYATASFGQGIAITPINMACALSALANGGIVPTPTVAREVRYRDGRVRAITPPPGVRAIGPEASEEVTRMLVEVTDSALLGGSVKIPEYAIAAKTGTAQLPRPRVEGGGYYDDRYVHSFFGYFPAYDPEFLVFLYTVDPKEVTFASHTLTQPFMRLAKFLIHYYDIPPDRDPLALGDAPYRVGDR